MRRLQSRSRRIDPTIWIGKDGVSRELLSQVANQLKTRELVKLKVHKSALTDTETSQLAEKAAGSTESAVIEVMGHTFSLYKRREQTEEKKRVELKN